MEQLRKSSKNAALKQYKDIVALNVAKKLLFKSILVTRIYLLDRLNVLKKTLNPIDLIWL